MMHIEAIVSIGQLCTLGRHLLNRNKDDWISLWRKCKRSWRWETRRMGRWDELWDLLHRGTRNFLELIVLLDLEWDLSCWDYAKYRPKPVWCCSQLKRDPLVSWKSYWFPVRVTRWGCLGLTRTWNLMRSRQVAAMYDLLCQILGKMLTAGNHPLLHPASSLKRGVVFNVTHDCILVAVQFWLSW